MDDEGRIVEWPQVGVEQMLDLLDTPDKQLRRAFDVAFFGALTMTRAVVPHMKTAGHGSIVNVGTMTPRKPMRGEGGYAAGKAAMGNATQFLALELGEHLVGDVDVGEDVLHVVEVLERLDEPQDGARGLLVVELDVHARDERRLGGVVVDPGGLERGAYGDQVGRLADHLEGLAEVVKAHRLASKRPRPAARRVRAA